MANQGSLKRLNQSRIMEAIRKHGALSRADVADMLHLDRKSLTNLSGELIRDNWLQEGAIQYRSHGRPGTLLELDGTHHLTIGIHVSEAEVSGVLLNLQGKKLGYVKSVFGFGSELSTIRRHANEVLRELLAMAGGELHAAGLAIPGIIDMKTGHIINSVNIPALNGMNSSELLQGLPCNLYIEEASRAKALAEKCFGHGRNTPNFICIDLGIGIGAGIVLNNRLHEAPHSSEIGHIIIQNKGRACLCGHAGCLEAYISERVLCQELSNLENRVISSLDELDTLCDESKVKLQEAGYYLGLGLASLVNILCPPVIVLNGNMTRFNSLINPGMERGLHEAALPSCRKMVSVVMSDFKPGISGALGAAAAAMGDIFETAEAIT